MMRQAYTMRLRPGMAAEYKKRHDEIWPELAREIRAAGVSDFSIFLDEKTMTLFVFRKISDPEKFAKLPQQPIVRKWWTYMAPLMDVNADDSPVEMPLKEVFRLE
ncbi:MAG TPA: L-rhamnose mutarotase [Candidatus Polarisedimenticolia bacterium]|nr:L-rhamnose mutarotase [Candidatus Polarisedimenticolia bacterium]